MTESGECQSCDLLILQKTANFIQSDMNQCIKINFFESYISKIIFQKYSKNFVKKFSKTYPKNQRK